MKTENGLEIDVGWWLVIDDEWFNDKFPFKMAKRNRRLDKAIQRLPKWRRVIGTHKRQYDN